MPAFVQHKKSVCIYIYTLVMSDKVNDDLCTCPPVPFPELIFGQTPSFLGL